MPTLFSLLVAAAAGGAAGLLVLRSRHRRAPAVEAAEKLGETVHAHPALRTLLHRRLDPESVTGLALSVALLFAAGAGTVLGLLAELVRTNSHLIGLDNGVAKWGRRHATPFSNHALNAVTELGFSYVIIALAVVVLLAESWRIRSRWIAPFVIAVIGGEEILTTVTKNIVDRTRPTFFNPAAGALGPSFPSGHSANAAAFYAAAALVLGRRRSRRVHALLAGLAIGIAVWVAESRVLLDVHWLTDVVGGLALGWAWFALCGIAFGGRLLRFGAAVEVAEQVAESVTPPGTGAPDGERDRPRRRAASLETPKL